MLVDNNIALLIVCLTLYIYIFVHYIIVLSKIITHRSTFPVARTYDLKNGETAFDTYECKVSYGDPSLKLITRNCDEKLLSASTICARFKIATLKKITKMKNICVCTVRLAVLSISNFQVCNSLFVICQMKVIQHCLLQKSLYIAGNISSKISFRNLEEMFTCH